jgi:hypothetical protein
MTICRRSPLIQAAASRRREAGIGDAPLALWDPGAAREIKAAQVEI